MLITSLVFASLILRADTQPTLSPSSPKATLPVGQQVAVVAIGKLPERVSWDYKGNDLGKFSFPIGLPSHLEKAKRGMMKRYVYIRTTERPGPKVASMEVRLKTAGGNDVYAIESNETFGNKDIVHDYLFELSAPVGAKKANLVLEVATGPKKWLGEAMISNGKRGKAGFDFQPELQSTNGGDLYVYNAPANTEHMELRMTGLDAKGKEVSFSYSGDPHYPRGKPLPFGSGQVKKLQLWSRPYRTVKMVDVPLQP